MRSSINSEIITSTREHVRALLDNECTGHDWWHIERVWRMSRFLAAREGGDLLTIELAALLHDIADWKFHGGDDDIGVDEAMAWLRRAKVPENLVMSVAEVIRGVSFKGAKIAEKPLSREACIVQDADRLDALGAIGIARCFAYGGTVGQPIYDPGKKPELHTSAAAYRAAKTHSINHFYEKLLLLKDRMHTATARQMAIKRHEFLERYLQEFYREWQGENES